jgi:CRISPR-associated protein Cmr3
MIIKISALDTLFFKDGKPFSMGDETWADGIFPPPPSVFYGALRSAWFSQHINEFSNVNSDNDPTKNLKIRSIYFISENERLFPIARDFVKKKKEKENISFKLNQITQAPVSNYPAGTNLLVHDTIEEIESAKDALLSIGNIKRYLANEEEVVNYKRLSEFISIEPKIGMGRDNTTRTASEGKLYRVGMRRLDAIKEFGCNSNKFSFVVEFEGISIEQKGFIKLGAEGKTAFYESLDVKPLAENLNIIPSSDSNMFKLYLLTPGIFEKGWIPDFENNPLLKDLELEYITACTGKPLTIGGFDMDKKIPKPMRKAVPSGSVYYLKSSNNFKEISKRLNGISISEMGTAKEGFGVVLVGKA